MQGVDMMNTAAAISHFLNCLLGSYSTPHAQIIAEEVSSSCTSQLSVSSFRISTLIQVMGIFFFKFKQKSLNFNNRYFLNSGENPWILKKKKWKFLNFYKILFKFKWKIYYSSMKAFESHTYFKSMYLNIITNSFIVN